MTIGGEEHLFSIDDTTNNKQCEAVVLSAIERNQKATLGQLLKSIDCLTETQILHALERLIFKSMITNYKITTDSIFTINHFNLGGGYKHE